MPGPHTRLATFREGGQDVCKEIGRDADVGVADYQNFMFCEAFEFNEFGNFGVCAREWTANDELGVFGMEFGEESADDFTGGVVGRGDAEEDLDWARVIL